MRAPKQVKAEERRKPTPEMVRKVKRLLRTTEKYRAITSKPGNESIAGLAAKRYPVLKKLAAE